MQLHFIHRYTFTWTRAVGWDGVIGLGIHAKGDGIARQVKGKSEGKSKPEKI